MWDDFKIGSCDTGSGATCIDLPVGVTADISQNKTSYWLSHCICDFSGTICKNTTEGEKLSHLIKIGSALNITKFLDITILRQITPGRLRSCILSLMNSEFNRGKQEAQREMRAALGMSSVRI